LLYFRRAIGSNPDIIITTPFRIVKAFEAMDEKFLHSLRFLVMDEADLLLSFGYQDDMKTLMGHLPLATSYQTLLMSATLDKKIIEFAKKVLVQPIHLDLTEMEGINSQLSQYSIRMPGKNGDRNKFLFIYFIFKLKLIRGKVIVFVNNIDRGFRLRLFLEQFAIRSVVLNCELPMNSRLHIVNEFNRGAYDILIATDEKGKCESGFGDGLSPANLAPRNIENISTPNDHDLINSENEASGNNNFSPGNGDVKVAKKVVIDEQNVEVIDSLSAPHLDGAKPNRRWVKNDEEYGVSRGIDFHRVAAVVNFDFPPSVESYTHRVGRTARGGRKGVALSFVLEDFRSKVIDMKSIDRIDELQIFEKVSHYQKMLGTEISPYSCNASQVEAFRYRMEDGLRAVTAAAVREARISELKREILRSEKLKAHFEDHSKDLAFLRHDSPIAVARMQPHLKNIPAYLVPSAVKEVLVTNVPFQKVSRCKRKRYEMKPTSQSFKKSRKDPLRSLKL
jgi:ATP-dependent RNA helicase DDX56/DBP9